MVGYTVHRKYLCEECGASMAMDTLPPHLLRRMWGNLERAAPPERKLPPVDVCVVLCGGLAVECCRVMFKSLLRVLATMDGITFHLVNQDLPRDELVRIADMVPVCRVYQRPPLPQPRPYGLVDAEWSDDWMVRNCGRERWCVPMHFDLFHSADFLTYLRAQAAPDIALLGQQCPFVMVNRDAYAQSMFGFRTAGPFALVPMPEQPDQLWVYSEADERVAEARRRGSPVYRTSFDTGELLELELRTYGWTCRPLRERFGDYFYHFSGAGHANEVQAADIRRRLNMFVEEYGL